MSDNLTFECGMKELEKLVHALESGELSLDESFKVYKRAIELRNGLNAILDQADTSIRMLTESGEEVVLDIGEQA